MNTRQTEHRRHEIRVGLTIFIGLILIILAILSVGEQQGLLQDRYKLILHMSAVSGLQTGAPVRLAGVRVGSVAAIEFSGGLTAPMIEVILEIDRKVQSRIRADSRAHIGTLGLLGDKYIGVSMGSADQPALEDGDLLSSSDPIDVEKLLDDGVEILDDVKRSSRSLVEIADKINRGDGTLGLLVNDPRMYFDLDRLLVIMETLSAKIERGEGTLARLFNDAQLYDQFVAALQNAVLLTDSLTAGRGSAGRFLRDPSLFEDLSATAAELRSISRKLGETDNSAGRLLNEPVLYDDLVRITTELDSLVRDIRKNPRRYLKIEIF